MSPDTGLELDHDFDLVVDSTGDLSAVSDMDELKKDLAGQIYNILDGLATGEVVTPNRATEIRARIQGTIEQDPRVEDIVEISISRALGESDIDVFIELDSIYGPTSVGV